MNIAEKFTTLVDEVIEDELSDLHITTGDVPYIRTHIGDLHPVKSFGEVDAMTMKEIVKILLDGRPFEGKTVDCSYVHKNRRFRVNISENVRGKSIAMRSIPVNIPTPEDVSLPASAMRLFSKEKGIILITGPTGSGKTTTLASMIERLNETVPKHIITLEDPIEYVFNNKKALVHQREKGAHFDEFSTGIRSILREDPDIVMVGEMRDLATIEAALTLAETGHLVLSTLHTNDTAQSVDRIIFSFPGEMQNQVRMQFSLALVGIISQVLIPRIDNSGRVPAREVLINNDAIRNLIARGEIAQIYSVLEMSRRSGMNLMDDALIDLIERKIIAPESAIPHMRDRSRLESLLG